MRRLLRANRQVRYLAGILALLTILPASVAARPQNPSAAEAFAQQLSNAYASIASRLEPMVVSIDVVSESRRRGRGGAAAPREVEGVGSGIIVDPAGYILTNNHVVEDASRITVRLRDEVELPATVVGTDPDTDLALLRVNAATKLPAVTFGDSEAVQPGHLVLALGSPFGFNNSVSAGIVSAKGRDIPGAEPFQHFIQTDAAIHPGNSGGPLVNMAGEVIGINTAVVTSSRSSSGIGFALPSNTALRVFRQLQKSGRVVRGSIGIRMREGAPPDSGVVVIEVHPAGPANTAGMRSGDVIVEAAGRAIKGTTSLLNIIADQETGTSIPLRVLRDGAAVNLQVGIADRAVLYPDLDGGGSTTPPARD
jgi:serine protease Do